MMGAFGGAGSGRAVSNTLSSAGRGGASNGGGGAAGSHRALRGRVVAVKDNKFGFIRPLSGASTASKNQDLFFMLQDCDYSGVKEGDVLAFDTVDDPMSNRGKGGKRAIRLHRVGGSGGAIDEISSALQEISSSSASTGQDDAQQRPDAQQRSPPKGQQPHKDLKEVLFSLRQLVAVAARNAEQLVLSGADLTGIMARDDLPFSAIRDLCDMLARPTLREHAGAARIYRELPTSNLLCSPRQLRAYLMMLSTDAAYRLVAEERNRTRGRRDRDRSRPSDASFRPSDPAERGKMLARLFLPVAALFTEMLTRDRGARFQLQPLIDSFTYAVDKAESDGVDLPDKVLNAADVVLRLAERQKSEAVQFVRNSVGAGRGEGSVISCLEQDDDGDGDSAKKEDEDFRYVDVFPSAEDVLAGQPPRLRKNVVDGHYDNVMQ